MKILTEQKDDVCSTGIDIKAVSKEMVDKYGSA
jgi:hypothetical protein